MAIAQTKQDLNIKLLLNSRKNLLLSIVIAWVCVAMVFFAIKPQIETIFVANKKLDLEKKQFQKVTLKINELKQIEISDQFKQKEKVDEVLPSHKPILELLYNLHQTVQSSQVAVISLLINPGSIASGSGELDLVANQRNQEATTTKKRRYDKLEMELVVKGESDQVDQFLETIERIAPFTSVVELNIKESKKNVSGEQVALSEAEILLNTYFYTQVISTSIEATLPTVGEKELRAFNTIQQFIPSGYQLPTDITNADIEDLFEVTGFKFN